MRKQFLCAVSFLWLAAPALAQPTGTIRGSVRDSTQAMLPGAAVASSGPTNLASLGPMVAP